MVFKMQRLWALLLLIQHNLLACQTARADETSLVQLHAELHSAKKAADEHVDRLKSHMPKSRRMKEVMQLSEKIEALVKAEMHNNKTEPEGIETEEQKKMGRLSFCLSFSMLLATIWAMKYIYAKVMEADEEDQEMDQCEPGAFSAGMGNWAMAKTLGASTILWLLCGIICFTQLLTFGDDQECLTVIEAIYLSAQIVTTVGYGDHTPDTGMGLVFVAIYALLGVSIVASLIQELVFLWLWKKSEVKEVKDPKKEDNKDDEEDNKDGTAEKEDPTSGVSDEAAKQGLTESGSKEGTFGQRLNPNPWINAKFGDKADVVKPLITLTICLAFGTVFFAEYPGEGKTYLQSFYMSMITLTTIGFGAYHPVTQVGKLVGTIWMLVGVVCVGGSIAALTELMFETGKAERIKRNTRKLFNSIDKNHDGSIDRTEFIVFELVRRGVDELLVRECFQRFDDVDVDKSGNIDYKEFQAYADTL